MRLLTVLLFFALTACAPADYIYQRGCNPPFGGVYKCK